MDTVVSNKNGVKLQKCYWAILKYYPARPILKRSEIDKDKLFIELYNEWKADKEAWFLTKREIEYLNRSISRIWSKKGPQHWF